MKIKKLLTAFLAMSAMTLSSCDLFSSPIYSIDFSQNSYEIYVGEEQEILPTVTSNKSLPFNKELVWTVSNETIASVDNGVVKGLSAGTARVYATLKINEKFSSFYTINVLKDNRVTDVTLSKTSISLNIADGTTETITATVVGEEGVSQEVTWSSEDESVATVNNGVITPVAVGSTKITATSVQNPNYSKSCTVSVITTEGGSLTLTETLVELDLNSSTKTHQLNPTDSTIQKTNINWSTSDSSVATVSSRGLVTAKGVGEATITATMKSDPTDSAQCKIVVVDTTPVSISLDITSAKLKENESITLTASLEHATNQSVNWTSSSSAVSVTSTGTSTAVVQVLEGATVGSTATITAKSVEDPTKTATCVITVKDNESYDYDYTIMLYMSASSLEYDSQERQSVGLFSCDLIEILSVKDIPSSVKIIVETGGTTSWAMPSTALDGASSISAKKLQRWEVTPVSSSYQVRDPALNSYITCYNKLKLVNTLSVNTISDSSSLESFLKWGLSDYNAAQMGLILSGHGGGVDGCLYDDNDSNMASLNTAEVATAARNALSGSGRGKFTWIGYDCCIMAGIDNASINADYFEYMVASQESEFGTGYDHDTYLKKIISNTEISPKELLPVMAKAFVDENHQECPYNEGYGWEYCYQTTSVIDLSKIGNVVSQFNTFANSVSYSNAKAAFKGMKLNTFGEGCYGLGDLNNFLSTYQSKYSVDTSAIISAVNDCIVANYYCSNYSTKPCGLNIFFPESCNSDYSYVSVYKTNYTGDQTKLTGWQSMCLSNGSYYTGSWW